MTKWKKKKPEMTATDYGQTQRTSFFRHRGVPQ